MAASAWVIPPSELVNRAYVPPCPEYAAFPYFIYLTEIKTDYIKIDGSIISKILDDKISFLLVKSIVDFAKEADIKVIASCVNTKEIFELIKLLGIDYAQAHDLSIPQDIKN